MMKTLIFSESPSESWVKIIHLSKKIFMIRLTSTSFIKKAINNGYIHEYRKHRGEKKCLVVSMKITEPYQNAAVIEKKYFVNIIT